jgi:hypothetical protein
MADKLLEHHFAGFSPCEVIRLMRFRFGHVRIDDRVAARDDHLHRAEIFEIAEMRNETVPLSNHAEDARRLVRRVEVVHDDLRLRSRHSRTALVLAQYVLLDNAVRVHHHRPRVLHRLVAETDAVPALERRADARSRRVHHREFHETIGVHAEVHDLQLVIQEQREVLVVLRLQIRHRRIVYCQSNTRKSAQKCDATLHLCL